MRKHFRRRRAAYFTTRIGAAFACRRALFVGDWLSREGLSPHSRLMSRGGEDMKGLSMPAFMSMSVIAIGGGVHASIATTGQTDARWIVGRRRPARRSAWLMPPAKHDHGPPIDADRVAVAFLTVRVVAAGRLDNTAAQAASPARQFMLAVLRDAIDAMVAHAAAAGAALARHFTCASAAILDDLLIRRSHGRAVRPYWYRRVSPRRFRRGVGAGVRRASRGGHIDEGRISAMVGVDGLTPKVVERLMAAYAAHFCQRVLICRAEPLSARRRSAMIR